MSQFAIARRAFAAVVAENVRRWLASVNLLPPGGTIKVTFPEPTVTLPADQVVVNERTGAVHYTGPNQDERE